MSWVDDCVSKCIYNEIGGCPDVFDRDRNKLKELTESCRKQCLEADKYRNFLYNDQIKVEINLAWNTEASVLVEIQRAIHIAKLEAWRPVVGDYEAAVMKVYGEKQSPILKSIKPTIVKELTVYAHAGYGGEAFLGEGEKDELPDWNPNWAEPADPTQRGSYGKTVDYYRSIGECLAPKGEVWLMQCNSGAGQKGDQMLSNLANFLGRKALLSKTGLNRAMAATVSL